MDGRAREGRGTTLACGEWGETGAMRALHELTIVEAGEALRAGSVTATALTEAVLARIEATEPTLNAYITVTAEIARAQAAEDYTRLLGRGLAGLRVGVPRDALWQELDEEVEAACEAALEAMRGEGAEVREVSLPLLTAVPNFTEWAVGTAETSANSLELIGRAPADLPPALSLGLSVPAVEYINAQRQRRLVMKEMRAAFGSVDVLVSPTNSVAAPRAFRAGEGDAVRRRLARLTSRYSVTGSPALSVPCGFTEAGLPIGLSIAGGYFDEATVLRVADGYQQVTEWHRRRPQI